MSRPFQLLLIVLGAGFRLKHYLQNRSFWLDETVTAVSIVNRSWSEVLQQIPLAESFAKQPYIFSVFEKVMVVWLGNQEWVLRLGPFCASILSIILFYIVTKRFFSPAVSTLALALFAFNPSFVYYAAELKPYSLDVLITTGLFLSAFWGLSRPFTRKKTLVLGITGAISLWLSNSAVFVLAAAATASLISIMLARDYSRLKHLITAVFLWLISFYALYRCSLSIMAADPLLLNMWKNSFMPQPVGSPESIRWLKNMLSSFFIDPVGQGHSLAAFIIALLGGMTLSRKDKNIFWLCFLPLVFVLTATALQKYPFGGRMVLFLVPLILLMLAEGGVWICSFVRPPYHFLSWLVIGFMLYPSVTQTFKSFLHGYHRQDNRAVIEFLASHAQTGDAFVLNSEAQFPFWYYSQRFGCERFMSPSLPVSTGKEGGIKLGYVAGQFLDHLLTEQGRPYALFRQVVYVYNQEGYFRELLSNQMIGRPRRIFVNSPLHISDQKRVWFFFSSMNPVAQDYILYILDKNAQRLQSLEKDGAAVYLYDFGFHGQ